MRNRYCPNCGIERGRTWRWCGDCLRMIGKTVVVEAIAAGVGLMAARFFGG
jgi:hypothetical protein